MFFNFYGFFISLGILAGFFVVKKLALWQRLNIEIEDLLFWTLLPGLIGARIYHLIDFWRYYILHPWEIIAVWHGGLAIFGGLAGGLFGVWFFYKKKVSKKIKISFLSLLDLIVIGLTLGQAIGRWGNYFNQELYGLPSNLPWAIYIKPKNRLAGYENFSHFHPLFLYESLWCLLIFIILWRKYNQEIKNKRKKPGLVFFLYLFLYSFGRFWFDFLRLRNWEIGKIAVSQIISLGLMLAMGIILFRARKLDS